MQPRKSVNYSSIAIGLLLNTFKIDGKKVSFNPRKATVEVDGKKLKIENTWLSTTVVEKYYGGGMMAAPNQDRLNREYTCTVITYSSKGRLKTFLRFPAFSSRKHKGKKYLITYTGKHIKVTFDTPFALQMMEENIENVLSYTVDF